MSQIMRANICANFVIFETFRSETMQIEQNTQPNYRSLPVDKEDCENPVERLIVACGNDIQRAAGIAGVAVKSLYRWRAPRSRGGLDGQIPEGRRARILRLARESAIDFSEADLGVKDGTAA
jgi:hypothetical protein